MMNPSKPGSNPLHIQSELVTDILCFSFSFKSLGLYSVFRCSFARFRKLAWALITRTVLAVGSIERSQWGSVFSNTIAIVWFVTVKQQNTNLLSDKTDALIFRRVYRSPLRKIVWEMFCIQIHSQIINFS